MATSAWYRIGRVVNIMIARLSPDRRLGRELPITKKRIGLTAAMEIKLCEPGAGDRPILRLAPDIGTHDEDAYRRVFVSAVVLPLEPIVEEAELLVHRDIRGFGPEVHLATHCIPWNVHVRTNNQSLPATGCLR